MDAIDIAWPGGTHKFRLDLGRLRSLQTTCDAGPEQILARLKTGTWKVDDILAPIIEGLVGGGMEPQAAKDLVNNLADTTPLIDFKLTAFSALAIALTGPADDQPGDADQGEAEGAPPPENGDSPSSTAPAP